MVASLSGDLEAGVWVVRELMNGGRLSDPIPGTTLTASFTDGQLSGTAGCNSYFASYQAEGQWIKIGPIASTMAFCDRPEGVMDQEGRYLALLEAAETFERMENHLTMRRADGLVLSYELKEESERLELD